MGRVVAVCLSVEKGTPKAPEDRAELRAGHGIVGDAHAGPWHRQVSLLAAESIDQIRAVMPEIRDGAFAENIVTTGITLTSLGIGTRVRIGDTTVLEVTQIGKECHHGCEIRRRTGDCVMPREGIFCRVLAGGSIRAGDKIEPRPCRPTAEA